MDLTGSRDLTGREPGVDLKELYERRDDIIQEEKEKSGRMVMGTLCSYAPVELLHSFGILPVRIWGQAENIQEADGLLQPYICPPVRHLMALGIEGRYDFLDGIVHCYTCDATCGLYNIWVRNMQPDFSHLISLPYITILESREYAKAEFENFIAKLESFTGREYSPEGLQRSLSLYDAARSLIADAYRLKAEGVPMSYVDMYYANLGMQVLPMELFLPHLEDFLEAARRMEPEPAGGRRILLSGSVTSDIGLMTFVEAHGGVIVADDTCLGYRLVKDVATVEGEGEGTGKGAAARDGGRVEVGEGGNDPLANLVGYYLERTPCASRADFPARRDYLLEVLKCFDIDAVIFAHQKFCDAHLSDYPYLKGVLDEAGVPSMQLELEGESFNSQIQTRIEGFFEMIGAK
jgi:benzoyl-CoA reductase/2-hydroxyglutaryl-CoA dehydratase subunit BcrC/BadD/HgdB